MSTEKSVALPYLCGGMRFKVGPTLRYGLGINNLPRELEGRWVALVAAENDCHLVRPTLAPEDVRRIAEALQSVLYGCVRDSDGRWGRIRMPDETAITKVSEALAIIKELGGKNV